MEAGMRMFKLLSLLLDYPTEELVAELRTAAHGAALVGELDHPRRFSAGDRQAVAEFIDRLREAELAKAQAEYVQTFDLTPEHSLHLTHHLFGEEKGRGPALIDLSEYYRSYGLQHAEQELPDFLPLILEFLSGLTADEATVFLGDAAKVLTVLAANLEAAGSPYAPLIRVIENQGRLTRLAA